MTLDAKLSEFLDDLDRDFVPAIEAEKFVALMEETDAVLFDEWLHENAARFIREEIGARLRSERASEKLHAKAREFGRAVSDGDTAALISHFTVRYQVDEDNTRRRVADMTGDDHSFVAEQYHAAGKRSLMLESFHRSVAKKVGKKTTAEVMTEEQYDVLYRSLVTKQAA